MYMSKTDQNIFLDLEGSNVLSILLNILLVRNNMLLGLKDQDPSRSSPVFKATKPPLDQGVCIYSTPKVNSFLLDSTHPAIFHPMNNFLIGAQNEALFRFDHVTNDHLQRRPEVIMAL